MDERDLIREARAALGDLEATTPKAPPLTILTGRIARLEISPASPRRRRTGVAAFAGAAAIVLLVGAAALVFARGTTHVPPVAGDTVEYVKISWNSDTEFACGEYETVDSGEFESATVEVWGPNDDDLLRVDVTAPDGSVDRLITPYDLIGRTFDQVWYSYDGPGRGDDPGRSRAENPYRYVECIEVDGTDTRVYWMANDAPIRLFGHDYTRFVALPTAYEDGTQWDYEAELATIGKTRSDESHGTPVAVYTQTSTGTFERYVNEHWVDSAAQRYERLVYSRTDDRYGTAVITIEVVERDTVPADSVSFSTDGMILTQNTEWHESARGLGVEGLVVALEAEGAVVSVKPSPYEQYPGVTGDPSLVCIDGYEALAFEYSTEADRRAEADDAAPTPDYHVDLLWGTTGWWADSNVLLSFHYEPTRPGPVVPMLDAALGTQIGREGAALGETPDEIPFSDLCTETIPDASTGKTAFNEVMPVVAASMGPLAPVDTGAPLTSRTVDSDDVVLITDTGLTPTLVEALRASTAEMLESVDASPPYSIEAVFTLFGDTHAVVTYGDGLHAHVVVGDHPRTATSAQESWLDVKHGRRDGYTPVVQITWLGLPDDASYVVADYIGINDFFETENLVQQVYASSSFSAIPKPDWTQYVTLTAFDTDEQAVSSIEVLVDGGTCSAGKVNPTPMSNSELPALVDATRRAMFTDAVSCHYGDLVSVATEDGSFFGVTRDALATKLRDMDRRLAIMQEIRDALRFKPRVETRDGETVYVFSGPDTEIVLDTEGQWISGSA